MNNFKLVNLPEPTHALDAATKNYDDCKKIKILIGFVPTLCSASSQGFSVFTNSEFPGFEGWSVFSHSCKEWATQGLKTDAFLTIQLPFPVSLHAFALSGTNSNRPEDRWYNWRFQASNDNNTWTTSHAVTGFYLGSENYIFNLVPTVARYAYYRFYGVNGEAINPGLSYMQIYAVDNLG